MENTLLISAENMGDISAEATLLEEGIFLDLAEPMSDINGSTGINLFDKELFLLDFDFPEEQRESTAAPNSGNSLQDSLGDQKQHHTHLHQSCEKRTREASLFDDEQRNLKKRRSFDQPGDNFLNHEGRSSNDGAADARISLKNNFSRLEDENGHSGSESNSSSSVTLEKNSSKSKWTPEEDARLREAVAFYGARCWKDVAKRVGSRNHKQCCRRYPLLDFKTGRFSEKENEELIRLVKMQTNSSSSTSSSETEEINWEVVQQGLYEAGHGKRSKRHLQEHWDTLNANKEKFTPAEDAVLLKYRFAKWSTLSPMLPGRTFYQARARLNRLQKTCLSQTDELEMTTTDESLE